MPRRLSLLALVALFTLALAGCGGAGPTVEAHDIELPAGAESVVPMPEEASIQAAVEPEDGVSSIVFSPADTYADGVDFYTDAFGGGEWTVVDEQLGEGDEGEVSSSWEVEGHGVDVMVELTGFGGTEATNVAGSLIVRETE